MAKKSTKPGPNGTFRFGSDVATANPLQIEQREMESLEEGVSVSLKYYRRETECFSDWGPEELKRLSLTIEKMRRMSIQKLRTHRELCCQHKTDQKKTRFTRPSEVSKDLPLFEIRVAQRAAARIHGVFIGSVFHLFWLDREHAVFKS